MKIKSILRGIFIAVALQVGILAGFARTYLFIGLAFLTGVQLVGAQNAQFFRVVGPTATTITAFNSDGTMVWSGANPGATYQVQTATSLAGGSNWVDYVQLPVTNSVNTNLLVSFNPPAGMVLIPAGEFTIGDMLDGESDAIPTNVYVSALFMDTNLVSLNQWLAVFSYATNHGYGFLNQANDKAANTPVLFVDWFDCVKWCNARSQQAGLTPVYYTDTNLTQVFTNGDNPVLMTVYANWGANGYRLPTEAEWEKAARGGLSGQRFPWGDTISESQANYLGAGGYAYDLGPSGYNAIGNYPTDAYGTSPVGSFPANGYGLYDMAGNVFEWCWDWYAGPPYPAGSPYLGGTDPHGSVKLSFRVLRGGSWLQVASNARCPYRLQGNFRFGDADYVGFRCVKGL